MAAGEYGPGHALSKLVTDRYEHWADEKQEWESDWYMHYDAWQRIYSKKWKRLEGEGWRSRIFVGYTDLKVRTAVAILNETLLATGKIPFNVSATPVPFSLGNIAQYELPQDELKRRSKRMQTHIEDALVECKADRELKSATLEMCVYGTVILKVPMLQHFRRRRYLAELLGYGMDGTPMTAHSLVKMRGYRLAMKHWSIWDFFPDPDSQDVQQGDGFIFRDKMSIGQFWKYCQTLGQFDKKEAKYVIDEIVDEKTLAEDTGGEEGPGKDKLRDRYRPIMLKEYWGVLTRREYEKSETEFARLYRQFSAEEKKDWEELEVSITTANDHTIRAIANPYDGWRPAAVARYEVLPFEFWGQGIPAKIMDAQAMLNSLNRAYLDNTAVTAVSTGLLDPSRLLPGEDNTLTAGRYKLVRPGGLETARGADGVMVPFNIPAIGQQLLPAIQLWEKYLAEQSVPNILSGLEDVPGEGKKTATEIRSTRELAFKQLTEPVRNIDDGLIEPVVETFYHWFMGDPDVPEDHKADFEVNATGFSTFNDRNVRGERLRLLLTMALSNELLLTMTKVPELYRAVVKTLDEDPDELTFSSSELQERQRALEQQLQASGLNASIPSAEGVAPPNLRAA